MKKKISLFLLICIFLLNVNPCFADIYLTKDEEISYNIYADDGVFFQINLKKYKYIIKKYTIHNETNYDYCIIKEPELYNEQDYRILLALKTKSFEISEDTFLWTMGSVFCPLFLVVAIPYFLIDTVKTPFKAFKNRKIKKEKESYKQILKGEIIKADSEFIFYTLQNPKMADIPLLVSLKNETNGNIIELNEPLKAFTYSVKHENTRALPQELKNLK